MRTLALTFVALALGFVSAALGHPKMDGVRSSSLSDPDAACAACHQEIYKRYRQTPMAQGSGLAADGLLLGGFRHQPSDVDYKVCERDGQAVMSYQRLASGLSGERKLELFVGSGHRGRTYLYQEQGLWFEAPINYYSKKELWDMAPNFGSVHAMPDGLPVDSNCLHCHASEVQLPVAGTRNRYAGLPFRQAGIGCAACHGDASQHVAAGGHAPVLNPAKLTPARRDSVCLQCHLEGEAAIYKPGKSLASFKPGEDLADSVVYFVRQGREAGGGRAASQYEALLRSACKRGAGDALTCTTCHDPHGDPAPTERVAFYRNKCLACHTTQKIAAEHHPEQQDCAVCHMPTRPTTDISHEQTVDHNIQRKPVTQLMLAGLDAAPSELVPVGAVHAQARELGLAYAQSAETGNRDSAQRAFTLLTQAEQAGADDAEVHTKLGLIEQLAGKRAAALAEYDLALKADPYENTALTNKAVLAAAAGNATLAMHLLDRAVQNDPSQTSASLNLALIECVSGRAKEARALLTNLKRYNPDNPALQRFLATGNYAGQHCVVSP